MQLILASNNPHKKQELQGLLPMVELLLPHDLGLDFSCEENGSSYQENAQLKAKQLFYQLNRPILADDSGLEVLALQGRPGVHSARYAQKPGGSLPSSQQQITALLGELEGRKNRVAFFVCGLALCYQERDMIYLQCSLAGEIALQASGGGGFGYDPIFYLPQRGCTLAQLSGEEKNGISHRGQAAHLLAQMLAHLPL